MPTAIIIMYTKEGFAFAADGLQCRDDGTPVREDAQKIFPAQGLQRCLAYALAGCVGIGPQTGPEVFFDFVSESAKVIESLKATSFFGIQKYSQEVADGIAQKLTASVADANAKGIETDYPVIPAFTYQNERGHTIARLYAAGYYRGHPRWAHMRFFHSDQKLERPTVETGVMSPGNSLGYGSKIVAEHLYSTDDPLFSQYRTVRHSRVQERDITLSEALELVKQTVLAQASQQAKEIDPAVCRQIGGKLHAAVITRQGGFRWDTPPTSHS